MRNLHSIAELEALIFLYSNYCQIEATKTAIDSYFTSRTHIPNFFDKRDILGDDLQLAQEVFVITSLPQTTKEGYKVILGRLMDTDASKFSINAMFKL